MDERRKAARDEEARLKAVRRYRELNIEQDPAFNQLVRLAAQVCETPVSLITLVGEERQWFRVAYGSLLRETLREASFCAHTLDRPELFLVEDARKDPRFADNPLVVGEPYMRFYAGCPLIDSNGQAIGALCVVDYTPRTLTNEQGEALRLLAQYVMAQLELRYELERLSESVECRDRLEADLHKLSGMAGHEVRAPSEALRRASCELEDEIARRMRAEESLEQQRDLLEAVLDSLPGMFYLLDPEGRVERLNARAEETMGITREEARGRRATDFVIPADAGRVAADIERIVTDGASFVEAELINRKTGVTKPYYFGAGRISLQGRDYVCGLGIEISDKRKAEAELRLRERAIEASTDAIVVAECRDHGHRVVYANPAFERITGYSVAEAMGRDLRFLQNGNHDQPELEEIRKALRERREGKAVVRNYRKNGKLFWNAMKIAPVRAASGHVTHFVGILSDITEAKTYQDELEYQSNHDVLTGLANRILLRDRLQQAIAYAQQYGGTVMAVLIDLDHFKIVNESLGHTAGDELLKILAERLKPLLDDGDTLARPGGDEFMLVHYEQDNEVNTALLRELLATIAQPVQLEGQEITLTCSLGVSVFPQDGAHADTLLKHADAAMYRAKAAGRNNIRLYKSEMNRQVTERLSMDRRLRRALEQDAFKLYYQPQVDLISGRMIGMEALIRWPAEGGWISPARFIPLAEETGLIVPLGEWVLYTACQQNRRWQEEGLAAVPVGVNLSARQFMQPELVSVVRGVLDETGLDPRYLEIELTESAFMHNVEEGIDTLRRLKDLGTCLAVDDFGTGYSSLSYLKRFPVDLLKIDQSFVRDITIDPDDAAITQAVISLGHSLNLRVIAEGVETEAQHEFLRENRCDLLQGYWFSPPLPVPRVAEIIRSHA